MRQDPLDVGGFDGGNQFEIAFDPGEIQREQIIFQPNAGPTSELFNSDDAIGLHIQLMNGKGGVFGEPAAHDPLSSSPRAEQTEKDREGASEEDGHLADAKLPPLAGTKLYVQHMVALEAAVFGLTLAPHGKIDL